jgi:hypothetical protein
MKTPASRLLPVLLLALAACSTTPVAPPPSEAELLRTAPLHQLKPAQIDRALALLQAEQPDLRQRVATIARRFLNQPYELYLLGEFPYELYDPQPLFNLESSDCVVFVEHVYAMALSRNWAEFFWMLQRIRYRDGVIGVTTRNHYTEADWLPANRWLFSELTDSLLPGAAVPYQMVIDRERFFRDRYKLQVPTPKQPHADSYLPKARVQEVLAQLQTGDLVNIVTGVNGGAWVSHVGLVVVGSDGERRMLHSAAPRVAEQSFASYIEAAQQRTDKARAANPGKPATELLGFKFLRLNEQPEPPAMAPQPRPTIYPRVAG